MVRTDNLATAVCAVGLLLVSASAVWALDEPLGRRIPYQGRIEGTTGPVTVLVEFYDAFTAGNRLWGPEPHVVTPDAEGRFLIVIGSTDLDLCQRQPDLSLDCAGTGDSVPDLDQIDTSDVFLSVQVDDGATTTTLSPRQQLFPAFQAASVSPGSVAIERLAAEVANSLVPTGAVVAFAGTPGQVPDGWLLCDGAELSETLYPGLFSVLGAAHGGGAGLFRVPDYRGRFLRGQDLGIGRDPNSAQRVAMATGGAIGDGVGSVQGDAFQGHGHLSSGHSHSIGSDSHSHTIRASDITSSGGARVERSPGDAGSNVSLTAAMESDSHSHSVGSGFISVTTPSTLSGFGTPAFADETRPENAYVNYIIRCGPSDACQ